MSGNSIQFYHIVKGIKILPCTIILFVRRNLVMILVKSRLNHCAVGIILVTELEKEVKKKKLDNKSYT